MSKIARFLSIVLVCLLAGSLLLQGQAEAQSDRSYGGDFSLTCTDIRLDEDTKLSAECETIDKGKKRSGIYLNKYITNIDGGLSWKNNGNFMYSCKNSYLDVVPGRVVLKSTCERRDKSEVPVGILLDRQITNDDGVLKYANLGGGKSFEVRRRSLYKWHF